MQHASGNQPTGHLTTLLTPELETGELTRCVLAVAERHEVQILGRDDVRTEIPFGGQTVPWYEVLFSTDEAVYLE